MTAFVSRVLLAIALYTAYGLADGQAFASCRVPTVCKGSNENVGKSVTTWLDATDLYPGYTPSLSTAAPSATATPSSDHQFSDTNIDKIITLQRKVELLTEPGWTNGPGGYQVWVSGRGFYVTYDEANVLCESMNARVPVEGMRNTSLRRFVMNDVLRKCGDADGWWIGASDRANEGEWLWADGLTVTGGEWHHNQPDNWQGGQDCAYVSRHKGYMWDDQRCVGDVSGVVCERFADDVAANMLF